MLGEAPLPGQLTLLELAPARPDVPCLGCGRALRRPRRYFCDANCAQEQAERPLRRLGYFYCFVCRNWVAGPAGCEHPEQERYAP